MNKQELAEEIKNWKIIMHQKELELIEGAVLELVEELYEPQKPVVPQFVADWIEKVKGKGEPLYCALDRTPPEELDSWFCEDEVKRQDIFARAWLDGYTVEKEKRYLVKMKRIEEHNSFLKYNKNLENWYFGSIFVYNNDVDTRTYHTLKELEEDGFGEVFNSPLFEVEEVEE